jgi:hypothetical protein
VSRNGSTTAGHGRHAAQLPVDVDRIDATHPRRVLP